MLNIRSSWYLKWNVCFYCSDLEFEGTVGLWLSVSLKWAAACGGFFSWETAVTLFAFRAAAAAGHEGAFKSQMKQTDCETLFVSSARNVALF